MGIRQLRTLVEIADGGSFAAAARRLYLTQSAVSMQMKALEDEVRTTLFDRASRPPVLNSAGWRLVEEARGIIDRYDALRGAAAGPLGDIVGSVRLGVVPSVASRLLPHILLKLRHAHPGLKIQMRSGLSRELIFKVDQRSLDLAVVTEPDRLAANLTFDPIFKEEFKLVVHRDLAVVPVDRMFDAFSFARFTPTTGIGRIVDGYLRRRQITVNDDMEFDTIEAIVSITHMKLGIAIVPEYSIPQALADDILALPLDPPLTRRVGMVAPRGMSDAPTVGAVIDAFKAIQNRSQVSIQAPA